MGLLHFQTHKRVTETPKLSLALSGSYIYSNGFGSPMALLSILLRAFLQHPASSPPVIPSHPIGRSLGRCAKVGAIKDL